jgi:hypothetical protein
VWSTRCDKARDGCYVTVNQEKHTLVIFTGSHEEEKKKTENLPSFFFEKAHKNRKRWRGRAGERESRGERLGELEGETLRGPGPGETRTRRGTRTPTVTITTHGDNVGVGTPHPHPQWRFSVSEL